MRFHNVIIPRNRFERRERYRCFPYGEILQRYKVNLNIFWLKDESLEESENILLLGHIAAVIANNITLVGFVGTIDYYSKVS